MKSAPNEDARVLGWELTDFGGLAHCVSHWSLASDGSSGRGFPAGHAS